VVGHRATYLAPFSGLDNLRPGDDVTLDVPYGSFIYRIVRRLIVLPGVTPDPPRGATEVLRLEAGYPRLFPDRRTIVDARLFEVVPRGGAPFVPVRAVRRARGS